MRWFYNEMQRKGIIDHIKRNVYSVIRFSEIDLYLY
jgi:hypothetical protein